MKRFFFQSLFLFFGLTSFSQSISEALRYSEEGVYGTARYTSLSGAFGALGGDVSSIQLNPASSAVFITNTANASLGVFSHKNKANYFGTTATDGHNTLEFNQAGGVFVYDNPQENSVLKKFTLGINYQLTNNMDTNLFIQGQGNTSIAQYFLHYAQGVSLDLLQTLPGESVTDLYAYLGRNFGFGHQQALLGYQAYIIDPLDPDNTSGTEYVSAIAPGTFSHEMANISQGYNTKTTLNLGAQLGNHFFVGVNFNIHALQYLQNNFFYEGNSNPGSVVNRVYFDNYLGVEGSGFSTQLGVIAKTNNNFRFGLTYQSPTWFIMYEELRQAIETRRLVNETMVTTTVSPNVINVYEEYRFRTPSKFTGSIAYIFGTRGLLSIDYSYKDYKGITYGTKSSYFNALNKAIDNHLEGVSSLQMGGEYRYNQFSFRGGYRFETSPYQDKDLMGNLQGFSAGLGYNFGSMKLDAAYSHTTRDRSEQLFQSAGFTSAADITSTTHFYTLTVTFDY